MGFFDFLKGKGNPHEQYGEDAFAMFGITGVSPIDGQPIDPPSDGSGADGGAVDAGAGDAGGGGDAGAGA